MFEKEAFSFIRGSTDAERNEAKLQKTTKVIAAVLHSFLVTLIMGAGHERHVRTAFGRKFKSSYGQGEILNYVSLKHTDKESYLRWKNRGKESKPYYYL